MWFVLDALTVHAMSTVSVDSSPDTIRVLHLDDDPEITDLTKSFLEDESDRIEVITENGPNDALERIKQVDVDCIVCDYDMPKLNGLEFLEAVREDFEDLPFILFTGKGNEEIASDAISRGVTDYLQKGTGSDHYTVLANRVQNAVEKYRAVREVEERSEWYSRILAHLSDYVLIVNEMGKIRYVSPAIERVMGYTQEEIIGQDALNYVYPPDLEHASKALSKTIGDPSREVAVEFRSEASDGSIRWLEVRGSNFLEDPLIEGVMVNVRDVTERKEREQELKRHKAFLEQSMDLIVVLERDGTVDYVSSPVEDVLGYDKDDLTGKQWFDMVHEADQAEAEAVFDALTAAPDSQRRVEFRFHTADDRSRWLEVHGTNQLETPIIEGVVLHARDITQRKERERELSRQIDRLDEFADVVSHELRNPLNVARGRLDLLAEECDSEHLPAIRSATDRMDELINDLLTFSRSGAQVHDPEPVDLESLAESCWLNVKTFDATLGVRIDRTIRADESRLRQLLENVFSNAVEHGKPDGKVVIGTLEDNEGFYVEDDGPGIPTEDEEQVFKSGYSTSEDGTGFGLSIVKEVADAHGWTISVRSGTAGGARLEFSGVELED